MMPLLLPVPSIWRTAAALPDTLDWQTYKQLSDQPEYWSNWMLTQCIDLLGQLDQAELATQLQTALAQAPLDTPADYKGPLRMHRLQLSAADAQRLAAAIEQANAQSLTTEQTASRGLGGFVEVCQEYALARSCANV